MGKKIKGLFILSLLILSSLFPILNPAKQAEAATIHAAGDYTWVDAAGYYHTTAYLLNGSNLVYCYAESNLPPTSNGTGYNNGTDVYDFHITSLLYYGYGGGGYKGNGSKTDYVKTWVALNNWKNGQTTVPQSASNSDSFVASLIKHAEQQDAPRYNISFNTGYVSSNISGTVQKSGTIKVSGSNASYASLNIPSGITIHVIGGKVQKGGSIKVKGGQSFYFTAPLSYNSDYKTGNVNAWEATIASILYIPYNQSYQTILASPFIVDDPTTKAGFTVHFWTRTEKVTRHYVDDYTGNKVKSDDTNTLTIGSSFSYTPPKTITSGGDSYDADSTAPWKGKVPSNSIDHTFGYKLRREVTVNYLDNRTGKPIASSKSYSVHQGDHYSEAPPTNFKTKNGEYTYRYVKESGDSQSGTISRNNITINYYYDIPLIKTGLKDLKIYTAPVADGLPVSVQLNKIFNYSSSLADMSKSPIAVSLYQGSKRIATQTYTAASLPEDLTFKISSRSGLVKNTHKPYTVKFENYNANDVKIEDDTTAAAQLTTDGYTSSEDTVTLNLKNSVNDLDQAKRVVMTEIAPKQSMTQIYETFNYSATPLPKTKTGYGVASTVRLDYQNELGVNYNYATPVSEDDFTFQAPSVLQDKSYLDYPVKNGDVNVPMTATRIAFVNGSNYWRDESFVFPHMNVEDDTGHLFTDEQAAAKDSRIKKKLYNGHNEFYTPIWPDKSQTIPATYNVDYSTNPLGVNKVTLKIQDQLQLVAYMYAWMGSSTINKDELLMEPVNTDNPFPNGLPPGWTKSDEQWIEND
ncbi:MucBP domain-containing protein [Sporolactobacillus sp. KGMB 08714]|uniref:MucBP domain-containing protein n=1 Tax=Sporolactobacillus sp. KGMB 08714 TaxID=3064704 RepID=UPI002FBE762C